MRIAPTDWPQLVALQPALASIPPYLQLQADHIDVSAGETLCRIGDRVRYIFLVIRGEVRLIRRGQNGNEAVLQRARGGFLAEASLSSKVYHCDLVVIEEGELLRFSAKDFRQALDTDSEFRDAWLILLSREVRKLRSQNERLSLHTASERIIHYIEAEGSEGSISLNQSRKAWASELGLTHEALYRALRRLQDEGTLHMDEDRISIRVSPYKPAQRILRRKAYPDTPRK